MKSINIKSKNYKLLDWGDKLDFGIYKDKTIKEMYDGGHIEYLLWVYNKVDNIKFSSEIEIIINKG